MKEEMRGEWGGKNEPLPLKFTNTGAEDRQDLRAQNPFASGVGQGLGVAQSLGSQAQDTSPSVVGSATYQNLPSAMQESMEELMAVPGAGARSDTERSPPPPAGQHCHRGLTPPQGTWQCHAASCPEENRDSNRVW